jgi:hypothetical protein
VTGIAVEIWEPSLTDMPPRRRRQNDMRPEDPGEQDFYRTLASIFPGDSKKEAMCKFVYVLYLVALCFSLASAVLLLSSAVLLISECCASIIEHCASH